ncbi:Sodium/hydrogen exchanger family-domain-containing protein [Hypomontagnella monticulosa]|nr:Sodium/hydrogen exchanger family-domain-containing protein [Hypomontagnella monticulosa]
MPSSLPYHEPSITQLLTLSSFLLALNAINSLLDHSLYCGLIGQVLVGIAFGAPGADILSPDLQSSVVQLGFLGLILIVFEGGAATSVAAVKRNLGLSAIVAATGVAAPLALSFAFLGGVGATPVQAFAAGAALASTSLGTTFSVLAASGLADTRLGSVLGTAAMMDDVLGLVMVQVVSSLGASSGVGEGGDVRIDVGEAVLRPVLVSLGFAIAVPVACRFVVRPFVLPLLGKGGMSGEGALWRRWRLLDAKQTGFVAQTALLVALVVAASYAGASVLLAAYLAGIVVSWWDSQRGTDEDERQTPQGQQESESHGEESTGSPTSDAPAVAINRSDGNAMSTSQPTSSPEHQQQIAGHNSSDIYETYYSQAVNRILKPFFFASVGFSIPISDMFSGEVVWRGVIYSILMAIGKMMCGLWLVRFPISANGLVDRFRSFVSSRYRTLSSLFSRFRKQGISSPLQSNKSRGTPERLQLEPRGVTAPTNSRPPENDASRNDAAAGGLAPQEPQDSAPPSNGSGSNPTESTTPAKPLSLYPAAILSCAMVARGEIGFLVSAVAESNGVFRQPSDSDGASELFLVVTWAIVLCTIVGPICVGLLVRRVKKLEGKAASARERGTRNVLGVWGVS